MNLHSQDELYQTAHELHEKGALCEAATQYDELLRQNPTHLQALFDLGHCQYGLRRFEEAEGAFAQLCRHLPDNHVTLENLSYARLAQGKIEEGATTLLRSLVLNPLVDNERVFQEASRELLDFVRLACGAPGSEYPVAAAKRALDLALAWDRRKARETAATIFLAGERLGCKGGAFGEAAPLDVLAGFYLAPRRYGLELGSGCNLRCVYCCDVDSDTTKSARHLKITTRPAAELDREIDLVERIGVSRVDIGGHGEPTVQPHWVAVVNRLADQGCQLTMISNFAKRFSDREIETLGRIDSIVISCDTVDRELAAAIRPPLDVEVIFANMRRIRELEGNRAEFLWNTVVSDLTVPHLVPLVEKGIELGVSQFNLNAVIMHPYAVAHGSAVGMRHLSALNEAERAAALVEIESAKAVAQRHGKVFWTDQAVFAALREGFADESADGSGTCSYQRLAQGSTRNCLLPWIKLIASRDQLHVCCHIKYEIDCFDPASYALDGEPLSSIRRGLLEGQPVKECQTCRLAPAIPVADFRNIIANLYNLIGAE